jgi:hypothetical protein
VRSHGACSQRDDQAQKDEKAFAKRGSILGSLTASLSEALSSSSPAAASSASDSNDSIFMALKRKGSAISDAIFQPLDGGGYGRFHNCRTQGLMRESGRRPSVDRHAADAPPAARRPSDAASSTASKNASSTASGSKYELVQSILEDMGSKASSCFT